MKVRDTREIGPVAATQPGKAAPREPQDRVSLERTKELTATIERARVSAGAGRAAQLQALEAAIRSGAFKPNPQQVAEKILQAAEVDARLRELLK